MVERVNSMGLLEGRGKWRIWRKVDKWLVGRRDTQGDLVALSALRLLSSDFSNVLSLWTRWQKLYENWSDESANDHHGLGEMFKGISKTYQEYAVCWIWEWEFWCLPGNWGVSPPSPYRLLSPQGCQCKGIFSSLRIDSKSLENVWDSGLHHGNGDMNWGLLIVRSLECQCMPMSQYVATLHKYFYSSLDILHK